MRVRELAEWLGATFEGDGEKELSGVAALETAARATSLSWDAKGGGDCRQLGGGLPAGLHGVAEPELPHGDPRP